VVIILAGTEWLLGYIFELGSTDLTAKIFWNNVQYFGIVTVPIGWLIFALQYTGRENWLTRRTIILLCIEPIVTLLLVFTNRFHGLIWDPVVPDTDTPYLIRSHGVWYWIHTAYSYSLLLFTALVLIQMLIRSRRLYRRQASILLFAATLPVLANILMQSGLNPFPLLDLTPLAFVASNLTLTFGLYHLRLGDIVPVAREVVVESMGDGVIVLDELNRIVDLNPVAQRIFGCIATNVLGKAVEEIWPNCPHLNAGFYKKDGKSEETVQIDGNGQRTYDVRISPIIDWRNRLTSQIIVLRDVTDRKLADQALRDSEERLRQFVDGSPNPIFSLDRGGRIQAWNHACEEVFQYSSEEITGQRYGELLWNPGDAATVKALLAQVWQGNSLSNQELSYRCKDGTQRLTVSRLYPLRDQEGNVSGCVLANTDVTERRKAEKALEAHSEQLEKMVEERTRELKEAQERLIRQERLAVLGQLTGGIGHELRNPLGSIRNIAYFLNTILEEPTEDIKDALDILDQEVAKSDRIIRGLLDFAHAKIPIHQDVVVNDILKEVLASLDIPENITVKKELDKRLPAVPGDRNQLSQVFGNILFNGIQAMPEGGQLTIKTSVSKRSEPGWVSVSITDTGMGVSEENRKKIFEPLFTTKPQGIGLGLALTQMLVEGHGGTIELESEVGKGSTFTVKLPVTDMRE
jgi:PAS domain S-box-containing protein